MTLREELGVRPDPDFDLVLPAGWARHGLDDATYAAMVAQVKRRCLEAHRPELFVEMTALLKEQFTQMRRAGVIAFFSPTDPGPDTLAIPSSINATIRHSQHGETLDDEVRMLIREHGAQPLMGDKTTVRFETEKVSRLGTETIVSHSAVYLTPVPGSRRRRALVLVAGFGRPVDVRPDSDSMNAMRFLFDTCVSTLRWQPADQG